MFDCGMLGQDIKTTACNSRKKWKILVTYQHQQNQKICLIQRRNSINQQLTNADKEIKDVDKFVYLGSEMKDEGESDSVITRRTISEDMTQSQD